MSVSEGAASAASASIAPSTARSRRPPCELLNEMLAFLPLSKCKVFFFTSHSLHHLLVTQKFVRLWNYKRLRGEDAQIVFQYGAKYYKALIVGFHDRFHLPMIGHLSGHDATYDDQFRCSIAFSGWMYICGSRVSIERRHEDTFEPRVEAAESAGNVRRLVGALERQASGSQVFGPQTSGTQARKVDAAYCWPAGVDKFTFLLVCRVSNRDGKLVHWEGYKDRSHKDNDNREIPLSEYIPQLSAEFRCDLVPLNEGHLTPWREGCGHFAVTMNLEDIFAGQLLFLMERLNESLDTAWKADNKTREGIGNGASSSH